MAEQAAAATELLEEQAIHLAITVDGFKVDNSALYKTLNRKMGYQHKPGQFQMSGREGQAPAWRVSAMINIAELGVPGHLSLVPS